VKSYEEKKSNKRRKENDEIMGCVCKNLYATNLKETIENEKRCSETEAGRGKLTQKVEKRRQEKEWWRDLRNLRGLAPTDGHLG